MAFKIKHDKEEVRKVNRHLQRLSSEIKKGDENAKFREICTEEEKRTSQTPKRKKRKGFFKF